MAWIFGNDGVWMERLCDVAFRRVGVDIAM